MHADSLLGVLAYLFKICLETSCVPIFFIHIHVETSYKMYFMLNVQNFHHMSKFPTVQYINKMTKYLLNHFASRLGIGFSDLYTNQIAKDICTRDAETMR